MHHGSEMTQDAIRYSRTAMLLHWAIAILLVLNFGLGERTEDLREGPELFWAMQLHKSIGITVLLLTIWRLALRLLTPRPPKAADGPVFQAFSTAVHWGFYAVMLLAPVSGWVIVSTAKVQLPTLLFDIVPWPSLPNFGHDVHEAAEEAHEILTKAMIPLLALHLVGAVRHQFLLRDGLVERMVPAKRVSVLGFAALVASLALAFVAGKSWPAPDVAAPGEPLPDFQSAQGTDAAKPANVTSAAPVTSPAAQMAAAPVPIARWQVVPGGQLGFKVMVNGEEVRGRFSDWTADIRFDPEQLDKSSIRATVRLASVASGDQGRDGMLQGDDFFGAARPMARFTAERIRARGGNRYQADGALTLKGISQPLSLAFSLNIRGDRAQAQATTRFDRRDFGIGTGQFAGTDVIGGDVHIDLAFNARRIAENG